MQRILIGLCAGIVGALINIVFLLFAPDLKIEVFLSTGVTWISIGILISVSNVKLNSILKGLLVSTLVSASSLIYTITSSLSGAIWTMVNTLVTGAIIGYVIDKVVSKSEIKNKDADNISKS